MKLSVIVLTYKQVAYIKECIDSILAQEVDFDYEIIVGDDASNDGTEEILLEYKNMYPDKFVLLINKENIGANNNYLNTLCACKGKYIATIEGDDFWCEKNKLKKQVDYLETHENVYAVASNYYVVNHDGTGRKIALSSLDTNKTYTMRNYLKHSMKVHSNTMMYRNELPLQDEKFRNLFSVIPTMGDVIIRAYIYSNGKLYASSDCTLCHRLTATTVPTSYQAQEQKNVFLGTEMMEKITLKLNEYYSANDFFLLVCNRLGKTLFLKVFKHLKCDMKKYWSVYKDLKLKYKFVVIHRFMYFTFTKITGKIIKVIAK